MSINWLHTLWQHQHQHQHQSQHQQQHKQAALQQMWHGAKQPQAAPSQIMTWPTWNSCSVRHWHSTGHQQHKEACHQQQHHRLHPLQLWSGGQQPQASSTPAWQLCAPTHQRWQQGYHRQQHWQPQPGQEREGLQLCLSTHAQQQPHQEHTLRPHMQHQALRWQQQELHQHQPLQHQLSRCTSALLQTCAAETCPTSTGELSS